MSERTLIASATNLLARGFLVVPTDRRSPAGAPVNGLYAVARACLHVLAWKAPARAVAIVDLPGRDWPALLEPQLEGLKALLEALGFTVVEGDGEPHLVASYTQAALDRGDDVVIAGMDKRYAQLVSDAVWWYDANKDARYTPEVVRKRFNVGPDQVADWLAFVGDDDQLPGVTGIGAKGATQLLEAHGSADVVMATLETLEGRAAKALLKARDEVPRELARARLDRKRPLPVALEKCTFAPRPAKELNALFESLGFVELLLSDGAVTKVKVCTTAEELGALEPGLSVQPLIDGPGGLVGIALSSGDGWARYVPAGSAAWPVLSRWLADGSVPKRGHDLMGLRVALHREKAALNGLHCDSSWASHLTQPSGWAPHELPGLARVVLGRSLPDDDELLGTGRGRKRWADLPVEKAAQAAAQRAEVSAAISKALEPKLQPQLVDEYRDLSDVLLRMELHGLAVDLGQLHRAEGQFAQIEKELEAKIEQLAGHPFNINSSQQLGKVLFEELKLEVVSHTKTGWSTANEALERIEHAHPIVALVLRWRLLRRLRDSWIHSLERYVGDDGRVHSRFDLARSFSGQLVNSNPDLGRVPGRTEEMAQIRRAFVAPPGWLLMSVDFSQLGLHVLAHLTKDPALVEPLKARADLHRLTAAAVLEKDPEAVTFDERQLGKVVNFATFAGQGPSALALQLGITPAEAKEYVARFDRRYACVRAFQDEQLRLAKQRGFITTLAGRQWPIGGLESLDPQLRSYAERMARRGTHEGSVADVSRRALLEADRALKGEGLKTVPLVQVVDEVLFEVPEGELPRAAKVCADAMRGAFELEVPLKAGVEAGPTWADLQPVKL